MHHCGHHLGVSPLPCGDPLVFALKYISKGAPLYTLSFGCPWGMRLTPLCAPLSFHVFGKPHKWDKIYIYLHLLIIFMYT